MKVDIASLKLPDGWTASSIVWPGGSFVVLEAPVQIGGFVTIDFDRRVFAGGYGRPGQTNLPCKKSYSGRGWQEAIVVDAVHWLQSVMTA